MYEVEKGKIACTLLFPIVCPIFKLSRLFLYYFRTCLRCIEQLQTFIEIEPNFM